MRAFSLNAYLDRTTISMKNGYFFWIVLLIVSCTSQSKHLSTESNETIKKQKIDSTKTEFEALPKPIVIFQQLNNCKGNELSSAVQSDERPTNIRKEQNGDTLVLNFQIVSDCCREFEQVLRTSNDTIFLDFQSKEESYCECYCTYKLRYSLVNNERYVIYLRKKKV